MAQLALYRKYRSQTFEDLIGQEHITKTLQAAVASGRFAHAYLFTGPRGTGKTSAARILAKALNCEQGPIATPCNVCAICKAITNSSHPDVLELDAASEAGVEDVRNNIIERARYTPMEARMKVYIIDEVHDLSAKAFDALLKTIEEPPAHVVFVLATTEFWKVPVTIRSRCQRFEFYRGTMRDIVNRLEQVCKSEGIEAEPAALNAIARMSDGGFRDALTLLEQAVVSWEGKISLDGVTRQLGLLSEAHSNRILEAALAGDVRSVLMSADEAIREGKEPRQILEGLLHRLSALTYAAFGADAMLSAEPEQRAADHAFAARIGKENLLRFRSITADAYKEVRDVGLPRLWLELTLLKLIQEPAVPIIEKPVNGAPAQAAVASPKPVSTNAHPMQEKWDATIADIQAHVAKVWPLIRGTSVAGVEGNTVRIQFPRGFQHDRLMGKDEVRRRILERFQKVMGGDQWRLEFILASEQPEETAPEAVESPLQGEPLANAVQDLFGVQPEN